MKLTNKELHVFFIALIGYSFILAFVENLLLMRFICGVLFGSWAMTYITNKRLIKHNVELLSFLQKINDCMRNEVEESKKEKTEK